MKPRLFSEPRPGVLRIRNRFGLLRAFGIIPLLLSGIAIHQGISGQHADRMPPLMAVALGLLFGCVGLVLLFGTLETTLDRSTGVVCKTASLLFLKSRQTQRLDRFRSLRVSWEYSRNESTPPWSYRVYVLSLEPHPTAAHTASFELARSSALEQVRLESTRISDFLGIPVQDDSQSLICG